MKQVTKYIGMLSIVAIFALAAVSGSIDEAEAKQAEDSNGVQSPKFYSSATYDPVSDDILCEYLKLSPSECKELLQ